MDNRAEIGRAASQPLFSAPRRRAAASMRMRSGYAFMIKWVIFSRTMTARACRQIGAVGDPTLWFPDITSPGSAALR